VMEDGNQERMKLIDGATRPIMAASLSSSVVIPSSSVFMSSRSNIKCDRRGVSVVHDILHNEDG